MNPQVTMWGVPFKKIHSTVFVCVCVSEPEEFEDFDGDEEAVDLRAFSVMGGLFHFNLLQLPPQPKTVQNWTITQGVYGSHVPMIKCGCCSHKC